MIRAGLIALALALATTSATASCRQALALGLDVSGSVDAKEYRAQLDGLASALNDAEVRSKILEMPSAPVRLLVYEWSGPGDQHVLLPWTTIDQSAALDIAIETLRQTRRRDATPGTALGVAMTYGARQLTQQSDCWKRTLDISGDGKSNLGPRPRDVKHRIERSGITINGLVIGADAPNIGDLRQAEISELSAYYSAEVILGQEAFVQAALGYDSYADAMKRKLLRELEGLILSYLPPLPDR
ncbi:DUF1194 domain-containing protein [Sulfitobacter mediterraneus]|uniref:DUF1194 domain-containing protein n=1 Tax=Sulfitobacter mediterraneus TaxID=83219 RepID=UPI001939E4C9|nr:DUF1194 domain-containing protein [Sulfitobacter mediterraneus]MBM1556434.1 DUF1194 domain-containing protein [Sulfitobacter mediterraneus]MBM1567527.1 DUF1194 domain-containing protein [Sulfitobacter mediterraneus]MBM1571788.1 DUF1194 domain-containing protein [Sulfitobacter mediterraneus]MBM1575577.1 DUF1194 domain-containing protein [Sulfitobacter mediterraneus]MBM1578933.1 DUF1194 domain-containing protein [Sulfitobacter mediterraneus]